MHCPNCDRGIAAVEIKETRSFEVKKERVEIEDRFNRCPHCGEEWSVDGFDAMYEVYRVYRERHRMVQPEALKGWRKGLGLTQEELSRLLGWSEATVVRYEKGALQEQSHDNELQMAMTSEGISVLLQKNPDVIPSEKRAVIEARFHSRIVAANRAADVFSSEEQSIRTGFQSCSLVRLKAVIAFLVGNERGVWKTTLNKLLWYADFLHFREHGVGITGLAYQHLQYGPVPVGWNYLYAVLPEDEFEVVVEDFPNGASGERIRAAKEPPMGILSNSEIRVLQSVHDDLALKGAKEISEISHREAAWLETGQQEIISYEWSTKLVRNFAP
jgi:putative zinc finger/helix-turn-helix YgiT family protein